MVVTLAQVAAEALALSSGGREHLVEILQESLPARGNAPLSEAWEAEIKRRLQEVENGAETFSAEEVLAELKQKYP